jgi:hypothetical protein
MAQTTKSRAGSRTRRSSSSSAGAARNGANRDEEMYRRAAEDALQQLDWAIGYLHGIHKTQISKALAKNRSYIRKRMLGEPEEPLPSEKTNET